MGQRDRVLLAVDGAVNLLLGLLLLGAPDQLVRALGAPAFESRFYPSILGAVLVGIALALFMEARRNGGAPVGLGLAGAIVINVCGAGVLAIWLVAAPVALPIRGRITLWTVAAVVLGIAAAEIATGGLKTRHDEEER